MVPEFRYDKNGYLILNFEERKISKPIEKSGREKRIARRKKERRSKR